MMVNALVPLTYNDRYTFKKNHFGLLPAGDFRIYQTHLVLSTNTHNTFNTHL